MKEYRVEHFSYFPDAGTLNTRSREGWTFVTFNLKENTFTVLFERAVPFGTVAKLRLRQAFAPLANRFRAQKVGVVNWFNNLEPIKKRRQDKTLVKFRKM